jgi:hypothetical protein
MSDWYICCATLFASCSSLGTDGMRCCLAVGIMDLLCGVIR